MYARSTLSEHGITRLPMHQVLHPGNEGDYFGFLGQTLGHVNWT